MLTEEEAKTKWCPHVRNVLPLDEGNGSFNRGNPEDPAGLSHSDGYQCNCIASACMAWRWHDQVHHRDVELWSKSRNTRVHSAYSDDSDWRPVSGNKDDEPPSAVGYCGLAGSPTP